MRDDCQRYLAFIQWDREAGIPDYRGISVTMAMPMGEIRIPAEIVFEEDEQ